MLDIAKIVLLIVYNVHLLQPLVFHVCLDILLLVETVYNQLVPMGKLWYLQIDHVFQFVHLIICSLIAIVFSAANQVMFQTHKNQDVFLKIILLIIFVHLVKLLIKDFASQAALEEHVKALDFVSIVFLTVLFVGMLQVVLSAQLDII